MEAKSDLQLRLVRQVLELIVDCTLKLGDPLREVELSSQFGVSRSPVRAALSQLAGLGAAARGGSRGMQVALDSGSARTTLENLPLEDEDQIREQIAKDWFEGRVPREISEKSFRLRYNLGKMTLTRVKVIFPKLYRNRNDFSEISRGTRPSNQSFAICSRIWSSSSSGKFSNVVRAEPLSSATCMPRLPPRAAAPRPAS